MKYETLLRRYRPSPRVPLLWWGRAVTGRLGLRSPAVLVYQMGKVGSTTVAYSLNQQGFWAVSVHFLNPYNIYLALPPQVTVADPTFKAYTEGHLTVLLEAAYRANGALAGSRGGRVPIIIMVRDAVARNLSGFFQGLELQVGRMMGSEPFDQATLEHAFWERYCHELPVVWFDVEPRAELGVDLLAYPFDAERGYSVVQHGNYDILLLKLETPDADKAQAIAQLLGRSSFRLIPQNVGENKAYSNLYKQFRRNLVLPDSYLERQYSSRFMQHFYTPAEIEQFWQRWRA